MEGHSGKKRTVTINAGYSLTALFFPSSLKKNLLKDMWPVASKYRICCETDVKTIQIDDTGVNTSTDGEIKVSTQNRWENTRKRLQGMHSTKNRYTFT